MRAMSIDTTSTSPTKGQAENEESLDTIVVCRSGLHESTAFTAVLACNRFPSSSVHFHL